MSRMIRRALGATAAALSLAFASAAVAQPIEIKIADSFPKGHVIYDTGRQNVVYCYVAPEDIRGAT